MNERQSLVAFCVLVGAICYLATVAAVLAWHSRYAEALGFGGLTTGLVGVLGSFRSRTGYRESEATSLQEGDRLADVRPLMRGEG